MIFWAKIMIQDLATTLIPERGVLHPRLLGHVGHLPPEIGPSLEEGHLAQRRGEERGLAAADAADDGDERALGHAPVDVSEDGGPAAARRRRAPGEGGVGEGELVGVGLVVADLRLVNLLLVEVPADAADCDGALQDGNSIGLVRPEKWVQYRPKTNPFVRVHE